MVITGPTASGKTSLAVELACFLGTEIVNADSRQVFRGIPIATAMPTAAERAAAPHRLLDFLPLDAYYNASMFEADALREIAEVHRHSDYAVMCGGSMMYVDAVCRGIDPMPDVPAALRASLKAEYAEKGFDWLMQRLQQLDSQYASEVDTANPLRVFHAVEICLASGKRYSELRTGRRAERPFRIVKVAIDMPRDALFGRINARVERMMAEGLEQEARKVYHLRHLNALNTVGLKEMFAYFDGEMNRDTAVARIAKNTRVYAKKQLTWLKRDNEMVWLPSSAPSLRDEVLALL